jgi:N-methylhydantoinase A
MTASARARLGVDIGGTFTDIALDLGDRIVTAKVLTTPRSPADGVMAGIRTALDEAGIAPRDVGLIIHGTTLATNALIERKGARTAVIATEGHRDTLELGYEDRFSEYDIFIEKSLPLVARDLRFTVPERCTVTGQVLRPLDTQAVQRLVPELRRQQIESIAVCFIHGYAHPAHEQAVREILAASLPDVAISLSSEVCPEIREYDRVSTTVCNAYVQPLMAGYLRRLAAMLAGDGLACPLLMMLSGGGLATLETAIQFPIRLVESGPAGGAIIAGQIAAECGLPEVLSFDMGGTTAKVCLIDHFRPPTSRNFEVDRVYRFLKGSGLPVRIPVIEMVEIGAGGGSIASVDRLRRLQVGPQSAGAEPGPACYGQGGAEPTVTDADLVLGRIDAERFAGGRLHLDPVAARQAIASRIGAALRLDDTMSAHGISEIVDENMANAARVHAIERGKSLATRTLIAFGGAAPLHAARLADKLGITRIIVPAGAGVASAVGFLRAPFAYDVVRSRHMRLDAFDPAVLNSLGHETSIALPVRPLHAADAALLRDEFHTRYAAQYGRSVAGVELEILTISLRIETAAPPPHCWPEVSTCPAPPPLHRRPVFDAATGTLTDTPIYWRPDLPAGSSLAGPAVIAEPQTSTLVPARFDAQIDAAGNIVLQRNGGAA